MNKLSSFITHQTFIDFIIRFLAKKEIGLKQT